MVDVYRGTPPPENIESRDAEESDIDDFEPYISAIDDGKPTIELKALAIPAPGEEHDPESSSGSLKRFTNKPKVL